MLIATTENLLVTFPRADRNGRVFAEIINPADGRRFRAKSPLITEALALAATPHEATGLAAALANSSGITAPAAAALVDHLLQARLLGAVTKSDMSRLWRRYNWEVPYVYQCMSRAETFEDVGPFRSLEAIRTDVVEEYRSSSDFPYIPDRDHNAIPLPSARRDLSWPLGEVLLSRKTYRTWSWRLYEQQELSDLLWYGFRPIGLNRAVIAADPRFEDALSLQTHFAHLGVFVITGRVTDIPAAVYRYDPIHHSLAHHAPCSGLQQLEHLCVGQVPLRDASAVVVITGRFAEFMWRYRHNRAYRVLLLETGQMMQNLILVATAMRMRPFITPALRDSEVDGLVGVDGYTEGALYLAAVG